MKKPVNADAIANELREGSAFFRQAREQVATEEPAAAGALTADEPTPSMVDRPANRSAGRSASQSTDPSTTPPAKPTPAAAAVPAFDTSAILGRPKSFYITERQDRELDIAVGKLQEKLNGRGNQKVDRSTVMRLLLEVNNITDDETVDRLAGHLVSRLVSQLTG